MKSLRCEKCGHTMPIRIGRASVNPEPRHRIGRGLPLASVASAIRSVSGWTSHAHPDGYGDGVKWEDVGDGAFRAVGATANGCVALWVWGVGERTIILGADDFFRGTPDDTEILVSYGGGGTYISAPPCGCSGHDIEHAVNGDNCSFCEEMEDVGPDEFEWSGPLLCDVIDHLESRHKWSRTAIADWVDGMPGATPRRRTQAFVSGRDDPLDEPI